MSFQFLFFQNLLLCCAFITTCEEYCSELCVFFFELVDLHLDLNDDLSYLSCLVCLVGN